jgi:hypothetical protein
MIATPGLDDTPRPRISFAARQSQKKNRPVGTVLLDSVINAVAGGFIRA